MRSASYDGVPFTVSSISGCGRYGRGAPDSTRFSIPERLKPGRQVLCHECRGRFRRTPAQTAPARVRGCRSHHRSTHKGLLDHVFGGSGIRALPKPEALKNLFHVHIQAQ